MGGVGQEQRPGRLQVQGGSVKAGLLVTRAGEPSDNRRGLFLINSIAYL